MKHIKTIDGTHGMSASVYRNSDWQEYVVRYSVYGCPEPHWDYHTDDKADAMATARHVTNACAA